MIVNRLYDVAVQMPVLRLHCTFLIKNSGNLPVFKGSTLHGWLGQQLKKEDIQLYNLLYVQHERQQPKPYAISCDDNRISFVENAILSFRLTIFGNATQFADRILQALLRNPLGLGSERLKISLQSVASYTPLGLRLGIHILPLSSWINEIQPQIIHDCVLQLNSPLRIKFNGVIIKKEIPTLPLLINQIRRRLTSLVDFWVDENPKWQELLQHPVPIGDYKILKTPVYYEDWQRYSTRQKEFLPFGGVMGEIAFNGDIYHAIEWLKIGQILQIGGKTTFGLGAYQLLF